MKHFYFLGIMALLLSFGLKAQTKRDGSPDMRYNSNKQTYGNSGYSNSSKSYSEPKSKEKNYPKGGEYKVQDAYIKTNGTIVSPHLKTSPDNKIYNNYKPKY
jgi:hypothetical protein